MKRKLKMLGAALGLGLLVVGLFSSGVFAQTPTPPNQGYAGDCHGAYGGLGNQVTLQRVADLLKVSTTDLQNELNSGKTLAQVAQAKGVSEDSVVATILAPRKEMMNVAVRFGYMTEDQAGQAYQFMAERTEAAINTTWSAATGYGPGGMMGGGGHMGGFGPAGSRAFRQRRPGPDSHSAQPDNA